MPQVQVHEYSKLQNETGSISFCLSNTPDEPEMKIHLNTRYPDPSRKSYCNFSIPVVFKLNGRQIKYVLQVPYLLTVEFLSVPWFCLYIKT